MKLPLHYFRPGVVTPHEYLQQQNWRLRAERLQDVGRTLYWCVLGGVLAVLLSLGAMLLLKHSGLSDTAAGAVRGSP
jgi:hypothetical protein